MHTGTPGAVCCSWCCPTTLDTRGALQVVVMIIDALRSDFYYEPLPGTPTAAIIRDHNLHMPLLHSVVQQAVGAPT